MALLLVSVHKTFNKTEPFRLHSLKWHLLTISCLLMQTVSSTPATMLTANATTKTITCQKRCGNVTIPYPFGIGKECAMGDAYAIDCRTTNHSQDAYLGNLEIIDISDTQLRIFGVAGTFACAPAYDNVDDSTGMVQLTGKPYVFSHTENKVLIIGCHHYGYMILDDKTPEQIHSCVSLCSSEMDLHDRTCSGRGCCQISMPKGVQTFTMWLDSVVNPLKNISSGLCTYSLVGETSGLKQLPAAIDIRDDPGYYAGNKMSLPFKLDWFVANKTCREAHLDTSTYACQHNTECVDLSRDLGLKAYRCKCRLGYEGNPYLAPGCTDVNECAGPDNTCSNNCTNTPGTYKCSCPKGYHGDGQKHGSGCFRKSLRPFITMGVGIFIGSVLLNLGGFFAFTVIRRKRAKMHRAKNFKRNGGLLLQQEISKEGVIGNTRIFTADELKKATDNFNSNRELGRGGQGTVYKGMLSDGSIVAIKKSKMANQKQLDDFVNEVVILSQINHRNIVQLLGCCLETEVPLLVYEYIPNGTLYKLIHEPNQDFPVTWELRLQIATDVAGALSYLHSASSKPIFHRDIKTVNIMLDAKYRAKVSDFGTSRSVDVDQTHLTTRVQGTFGYLDPEYFRSNQFTEKSDVYSFGVVLLELLTEQKAIRSSESASGKGLVPWFLSAMEKSNLYNIMAARVINEAKKEDLLAIANLARQCLSLDGKERPTMKEVAFELEVIISSHGEPVSFHRNSPVITESLPAEMIDGMSDGLLTSSTTSYIEDDLQNYR